MSGKKRQKEPPLGGPMGNQGTDGFLDQVRVLVTAGDTDLSLEQLAVFLKGKDHSLYNEALTQRARLNALRKEKRRGTVTGAEAEANRISLAVLELIDDVERRLQRALLPVPTAPVRFDPPENSALEKIFGANHLKSIAWLRTGLEKARSVCRVLTPEGLGTGFLIEGGRVLTNHHVIPHGDCARRSSVQFGFEEDATGRVQEGVSYKLRPETVVAIEEYDFCVVHVAPTAGSPPLEEWGHLDLTGDNKLAPGEHVTIIQHPGGGPKQIAITANQVVNIFDHRIQYSTDTLPGSSGAPVFNDDWRVVAVHHAGGNLLKDARGNTLFANEGILIGWILPHLGPK
jgi:V8-like Glu-specific endopeptidase